MLIIIIIIIIIIMLGRADWDPYFVRPTRADRNSKKYVHACKTQKKTEMEFYTAEIR